jgi:hypothetical protein
MEAGTVAVLAWGTTFWSEKTRRRAGAEGKSPPRHLSDILPLPEPARWWSLKQYHVRKLDSAFTTLTSFLSYATNPARGDTTAAGRGGVQSILASLYRLVQTASRLHRVGQVTAWRVKVTRSICRADNLSDRLSNSIRKICAKNFCTRNFDFFQHIHDTRTRYFGPHINVDFMYKGKRKYRVVDVNAVKGYSGR